MRNKLEIIIVDPPQSSRSSWRQGRFTLDTTRRIQAIDEGLIVPTVEAGDRFADREYLFCNYDITRDLANVRFKERTVKMLKTEING